jgi:hypothetical protein
MPTNSVRPLPFLRCRSCSRTVKCAPADQLHYTQGGWPRCCAEVMELLVPPEVDGGKDADSFKHNPGGQRA